MKTVNYLILASFILAQFVILPPTASAPQITCGETITSDTLLNEDLLCPPDAPYAIIIDAPNVTLDLGGHVISGHTPGTGIFSIGHAGITIRNGAIEGFDDGIFIIQADQATMENLIVRNLDISDPDHMIFGIHIDGSQNVVVRDSYFQFISAAHKEAVEIYNSYVEVRDIEVQGGGVGVNFSFASACDPATHPSNGIVLNSRFSNVTIAGIEVACSSYAWIEGNVFTASPAVGVGIQGDGWSSGYVTGLTVRKNSIHDTLIGIEFRGILDSAIIDNAIFDNQIWGVAIRQSLGCLVPETGLDCFYSTGNTIADNQTWGSSVDLYHYENSLGNTWQHNSCEIKDGSEIPDCLPPATSLAINYTSGQPGSFFTIEGANFPANHTVAITTNNYALGSVLSDETGKLKFMLNTELADAGLYVVTAGTYPSASAIFILDASKLIHLQEGLGTIFNLPAGISNHVYLPMMIR